MSPNLPHLFFICLIYIVSFALSLTTRLSSFSATYDYIVVGGGTAGLTLASRLSENPDIQVAVVEAGGYYEFDSGNQSVVPGYAAYGTDTDPAAANATPLIDWGFVTAPIEGLNGRAFHYARGKTLGGSSARNYMVYVLMEVLPIHWRAFVLTDILKLSPWHRTKLRSMGRGCGRLLLYVCPPSAIL